MAKRKVIRAYARHKVCGHVMEPFDWEINKNRHLRFESDGTAILTETGRVPRLVAARGLKQVIDRMLLQAARQTRCLHCKQDVVLTSSKDAVILDLLLR
jgi:hypothetical protein